MEWETGDGFQTDLQCTTMAPAYWGLQVFTFFRNFSIPMGVKGTPKSGQLVKWNCVTRRWGFLLVTSPTWVDGQEEKLHVTVNPKLYETIS